MAGMSTDVLAEAQERGAPGVPFVAEALDELQREEADEHARRRRRLMLAAQRGGVFYRELADALGRSKTWVIMELRQARAEEAQASQRS